MQFMPCTIRRFLKQGFLLACGKNNLVLGSMGVFSTMALYRVFYYDCLPFHQYLNAFLLISHLLPLSPPSSRQDRCVSSCVLSWYLVGVPRRCEPLSHRLLSLSREYRKVNFTSVAVSANLTSLLVGLCFVSRLAGDRQGVLLACLLPFLPVDTRIMLSMSASSSTATASARPLKRRKLDEVKEEKYEPGALRVIKKDVMKSINPYLPHLTYASN